ncbi:MAG TPA: sugar phosphate nucleotidyltransferase [Acidimicrobiales bacterium]|nr:sugar phosphate nucleotidyltransferase [Acidimicrobiales bacterium]
MSRLPPVCILAGGRGSRLGALTATTPKPLLEVAGEPFLCHQLRQLAAHGATSAVLCTGYRGDQIAERLGAEQFGIRLAYSDDGPTPAGTLGAIRRALPLLGDRFLVLYGDTYLQVNFGDFAASWEQSGLPAAMTVYRNDGRFGPSNADFRAPHVVRYDKHHPDASMRWIDYGLEGFTAAVVADSDASMTDLAELHALLANARLLFGFEVVDRFYEIGTPAALAETSAYLAAEGLRDLCSFE